MNFNSTYIPYASKRYPIYAQHGMVCASSPQAAAAGLEVMRNGGNAMDAAVATAAALTVCEPTANGIGGDCFALIWSEKDQQLYGLNASGISAKNISIEKVKERINSDEMPVYGWIPTMVPGAPSGWAKVAERFGNLPMTESMAPAIRYAREGYPCSPNLARMWDRAAKKYKQMCTGEEYDEWFKTFTPDSVIPKAGDIIKLPNHAKTLEIIAQTNAEAFYKGELADKIVADSEKFGGYYCKEDFENYEAAWVEPIRVNYKGYEICEIPPNGQGIVALMALNILKEFDYREKECVDTFHKQWEAMKIAFADGKFHVTDPKCMAINYNDLIKPEYGAYRAAQITDQAAAPCPETPPSSGTVYFCTADGEGNMVSFIQSNYMGFGSGIVVRDTGIALQNRGADFSLNAEDANALAPCKKSYHTIIPGFIMKDGKGLAPFGVMGGYMQPQGHVQVAMNLIDFGMNPQQALDAPRWQWMKDKTFMVEDNFSNEIAKQLAARGHDVQVALDAVNFGRGQIIVKLPNGTLVGGTESRTDSNIACW
ncbi:MAG: gamma-glutamyltransferase family protein [Oscillospiraceae bacterium]|nr:gamma-glutamyltransferase family protein [Oscillospiraceae bacterium]